MKNLEKIKEIINLTEEIMFEIKDIEYYKEKINYKMETIKKANNRINEIILKNENQKY